VSRRAGSKKVLLLVNADRSDRDRHSPAGERGPRRRTDFDALEQALDADVLDWSAVRSSRLGGNIEAITNWYVAASVLAFLRHRHYRLIWCMSEQEGSLIALLFKLTGRRTPLMTVAVVPTSKPMSVMLRRLRLYTHMTKLFPTSSYPLDTLRSSWHIPEAKVSLLPYQVDIDFFSEKWADAEPQDVPYILGVGQQARDYDTLIAAVRDLPVKLVIAADSLWARRRREPWRADLPANVSVTTRDYVGLRDLYAGSAFVVVPLLESDVQHGITSIQEAMSMGKAVVVTRTRGQGDLVADPRALGRDGLGRSTTGHFARLFAPDRKDLHGATGLYVPPGDVVAMRSAIRRLLEDPKFAAELGTRGRDVYEAVVSLDCFVERVVEATRPYV
jgi:glycosyltransferase involved in cell wall biosynthesis